ncbi:Pycsar system effector family protein [Yinghuangia soli]|uniref:DUF5706 domain-containing protein n=1 Tax=Yinghuangia soli TaxID=2908204 RepID=A0AA41Q6Z5_9ACTN|nr:Pycsar system effector family protein [Yinghuangia soli]MCF2532628.1 DUF5706 domain-containing protein [Yinghuangia soli]
MTAAGHGAPDPGAFDLRTAERLLADLRAETARADTKGSILVGVQGMAAAGLVATLTTRGWRPGVMSTVAQTMWWTGTVCFLVSLGALVAAVAPRYRGRAWQPGMPITHFADVRSAADHGAAALERALHDTDSSARDALLTALRENSRIVVDKYQWLRVGMACFMGALILLPGALLTA